MQAPGKISLRVRASGMKKLAPKHSKVSVTTTKKIRNRTKS